MRCAIRILELAADKSRAGYVPSTTNNLYDRLTAWYRQHDETMPIGRSLFYRWFGAQPAKPSHQLLECVPGFAALLSVEEYELFAAAGLLRPGLDAPLTIASAARQVRQASRLHRPCAQRSRGAELEEKRSSPTGSCTTSSTTRSRSGRWCAAILARCTCIR